LKRPQRILGELSVKARWQNPKRREILPSR